MSNWSCGGTISVRDLLESEKSILILGKPGLVKLLLFEIAKVLADEMEKQ
jgi:stage III sporulation protein SpoIIIAA